MGSPESGQIPARRQKAYVSTVGTTQMHLRNPFIIAFWSLMFPGLGHLLISKYLRGFLLFIWEVVINVEGHVNMGILYTFTGRFDMAKEVLNIRWLMLYIPTYLFAVWDSYRTSVDMNHNYVLASREDAKFQHFKMDAVEINYLDKIKPWTTFLWSLLTPGAGQIAIHRIITAFFILIWWIVIVYVSKLLPAIHFTMLGDFKQARSTIEPQWFLNIPSVYFFALYDAYANTVESNKLFEWEQSKFLKEDYQDVGFPMPPMGRSKRGDCMYIISTFEHSIHLETAVTAIQMKGIAKENILAVPMDKRAEERMLFDSLHSSDGLSMLDLPIALAAFLTLMGSIYGFILAWGPVMWGLIGMASGFGIGIAIKLMMNRKKTVRQTKTKASEVVIIVECSENQADMVKDTLWEHFALGVSKLSLDGGA